MLEQSGNREPPANQKTHLGRATHGHASKRTATPAPLGSRALLPLARLVRPYPRADQKPLQVHADLGDTEKQRQALANNTEAWRLATDPAAKSRDPHRALELA